jgi:hypothetical protein
MAFVVVLTVIPVALGFCSMVTSQAFGCLSSTLTTTSTRDPFRQTLLISIDLIAKKIFASLNCQLLKLIRQLSAAMENEMNNFRLDKPLAKELFAALSN